VARAARARLPDLPAFGVGYLLGALVPEAGQVIALAGAVLIVARQLERHGGPWAP